MGAHAEWMGVPELPQGVAGRGATETAVAEEAGRSAMSPRWILTLIAATALQLTMLAMGLRELLDGGGWINVVVEGGVWIALAATGAHMALTLAKVYMATIAASLWWRV